MDSNERSLRRSIDRIKRDLASLGDLRPGTLSEQYNVCGSEACRCKADPPRKHGPYFQLSYTRKGRSRTEFVRKEDLSEIRMALRNYQKLRQLIDEWIELSIALAILRRKRQE